MENPVARYWQIIIVLVAGGIAWGSLNADVEALKGENKKEQTQIEEIEDDVKEIDKKLVGIETSQKAIKEDVEEAAKTAAENSRKLDKILNKLEED